VHSIQKRSCGNDPAVFATTFVGKVRQPGAIVHKIQGRGEFIGWTGKASEQNGLDKLIANGRQEKGFTMRTEAPNACGGRFDVNFVFTTPELPCDRVTRLEKIKGVPSVYRPAATTNGTNPQITRTFEPPISLFAR
jgi:hypothetical protein